MSLVVFHKNKLCLRRKRCLSTRFTIYFQKNTLQLNVRVIKEVELVVILEMSGNYSNDSTERFVSLLLKTIYCLESYTRREVG